MFVCTASLLQCTVSHFSAMPEISLDEVRGLLVVLVSLVKNMRSRSVGL